MNETIATRIIIFVSVAVTVLVAILSRTTLEGVDFNEHKNSFGLFHASLNGTVSILLMIALYFIKQKNIVAHKRTMLGAFMLSSVFLISYVVMHATTESTSYGGEGPIRYVYFFVLLTHIVLAAGILPFILFTFFRALNGDYERHRKIAKITWPLWLYVTVTGVIVYFMISPYY